MSDYISHQDLLFPILKRMPVKTLLQWRCVCKSWKQLIDSTAFILDHLSVQRSRIIIQNERLEYRLLDPCTFPLYDTLTGPEGVISDDLCDPFVICSVHGVVFLYGDAEFLIWNPSIRQSIRIPFPEDSDEYQDCGFWIDPSTNDFKIVIVNFYRSSISLFSSQEEEAWREIPIAEELGSDFVYSVVVERLNSVMIGGVTHWIAAIDDHSQNYIIVFFDFEQDKFGTIQLPELATKSQLRLASDKNICKWKDLLSYVQLHEESHTLGFWVMQNGGWSLMCSLRLLNEVTQVFHVWVDWEMLLAGNDDYELLLYVPKYGCIPLGFDMLTGVGFHFAIDFVESLVFPYRKCISSCGSR